jgi:hypothetical protein
MVRESPTLVLIPIMNVASGLSGSELSCSTDSSDMLRFGRKLIMELGMSWWNGCQDGMNLANLNSPQTRMPVWSMLHSSKIACGG